MVNLNEFQADSVQKWLVVSLGTILVIAVTRLLSGPLGISKKIENGVNTVPMVPYWIPIIGHIPNMALAPDSLFAWTRKVYKQGIFSLNLGGTVHSFIFSPSLATVLMNQKTEVADAEHVSKYLMMSNYGFPRAEGDKYDAGLHDILDCYKYLLSNPGLSDLIEGTIDKLKTNIIDLVTFNARPIDQTKWERSSNVRVVTTPDGEQAVEASMLHLIRDFVAVTANPALIGTDFIENFPDYWSDLWTMDKGFFSLATDLPRWFPFPPLTRAHISLRRMLRAVKSFEVAMERRWNGEDPGPEWRDLDNVGAVIQARQIAYRKHNFSLDARAACEVALLWAMNANANPLIFWLLNHIYADKELLTALREEVASYVKIMQPSQDFPVPEPARLQSIDHEGLSTKCPLLKSAYIESLRLDTGVWSFKIMRQDFVLSSREKDAESFLIKKGTYAHVAHELHHTDPAYWDEPGTWRAERHIRYEPSSEKGPKTAVADMGTVRPYGRGASMCKGRQFAAKEILIFTAAIISLWDMEPAGGGPWKMPKAAKATGTKGVKNDVRVWIKRRKLPQHEKL